MHNLRNIVGLMVVMMLPLLASSQICNNYHRGKKSCPPSQDEFKYNGQSRSAMMYKGQNASLNVIFHVKQDYRISFCAEEILGDRVEFKIKDGKSGETLYDNADEDYTSIFEFSCDATRRLVLDITIPDDGSGGEGKMKKLRSTSSGCLGVLIEHMPTPKTGF